MLDVNECRDKNDTHVNQWNFNGGENQIWHLKKA